MPRNGEDYLPNFQSAQDSIRSAQAIFSKNICPSLDDQNNLSTNDQIRLKNIQTSIDDVASLFANQQSDPKNKLIGLTEDYRLALAALDGNSNDEKAMGYLASGLRKLEMTASKILALQNELSELSTTSPKYHAEHLRLTKLLLEWGHWNGFIRQKIDFVMSQNLKLAKLGKKPTILPADLAYLYSKEPLSQDLSPGGPKESYLELNRWFADSRDLSIQISKSLDSGIVEIAPPAKMVDAPYSPKYKYFETEKTNPNLLSERYQANYTTDQFQEFQKNADQVYFEKKAKTRMKKARAAKH